MAEEQRWKTYQEVAAYLLDRVALELGLERVEGEQHVVGQRSGTTWRIDGKGFRVGDEGFVIMEARRYTTSKQKQEQVGGLAYRIIDTGAAGGIMVSPLGLQEGARKVAAAENIVTVHMDENSTTTDYILEFLNKAFIGVSDTITVTDHARVIVVEAHGDEKA